MTGAGSSLPAVACAGDMAAGGVEKYTGGYMLHIAHIRGTTAGAVGLGADTTGEDLVGQRRVDVQLCRKGDLISYLLFKCPTLFLK